MATHESIVAMIAICPCVASCPSHRCRLSVRQYWLPTSSFVHAAVLAAHIVIVVCPCSSTGCPCRRRRHRLSLRQDRPPSNIVVTIICPCGSPSSSLPLPSAQVVIVIVVCPCSSTGCPGTSSPFIPVARCRHLSL